MTGSIANRRSSIWRIVIAGSALAALSLLAACGDGDATASGRSAATGKAQVERILLTEADAGGRLEIEVFVHDIGLPDKTGLEIQLAGDDASTLRWRFAEQPDALLMEWFAVDGALAFETDGLLGDPTAAAKLVELRALAVGEVTAVFELVERDPAARSGEPAKRLDYTFEIRPAPVRESLEPPGAGFRMPL